MTKCRFCELGSPDDRMIIGEHCFVKKTNDDVLVGSVMVLPVAHRETPFELTAEEWVETQSLLVEARRQLDDELSPDGYSVGWNVGEVGGQHVSHAHLHLIPRFSDEPLAGSGIRSHLKQPENRRPSLD